MLGKIDNQSYLRVAVDIFIDFLLEEQLKMP